MKEIDLSSIGVGMVSEHACFSEKGELLISKGVVVTQHHLAALQRRGIAKVYASIESDDEVERLLSADIRSISDLEIDEVPAPSPGVPGSKKPPVPASVADLESGWTDRPMALEFAEFKDIKRGEEGLAQLARSKPAIELDDKIRNQQTADRPVGVPIERRMSQVKVEERTPEYKEHVGVLYYDALLQVKEMLGAIADGARIEGTQVSTIVERFVRIFVTDRNILLNISATRHKDDYLYHHSLNVCLLSINIAASMGYSERQVIEIGMGALLHDVGMLMLPDGLRFYQGTLTPEHRFEVNKHPTLGLHLIERLLRMPDSVKFVTYQVHERDNGTGYPKGRKGRLLHRYARIVQVADVFEALSSPRSYRGAQIPYESMAGLVMMSRKGLLDPETVKGFLSCSSLFPVGSLVELSDHRVAKVIQSHRTSFGKPVVSVLTDWKGDLLPRDGIYQLDLYDDKTAQVARALPMDYLKNVVLMDGF